MQRTPSIIRRTHSSSISRQAQVIPLTSSTAIPQSPPSPARIRAPSTRRPSNGEKVKEWVDIFDGPMRPKIFTAPGTAPPPSSSASTRKTNGEVSSILFHGPARPRYIIPAANIDPPSQSRLNQNPSSSTQNKDMSALLSRSSLPPPRIYDGPSFEWELQTKRV